MNILTKRIRHECTGVMLQFRTGFSNTTFFEVH
jgi:hypothetical protein